MTHQPGRGKRYYGCLEEKTVKKKKKKIKHKRVNLQLKREATGHISIKAHLAHSHLHTHLRVFVHCRCIIFLLRKHSACLRKLYPFQIVNLSLIRPAVLPNIPGVVHFPSPPVWIWVRVCRGVRGASSRGRQRCSGGCLDTLISILNWSHTL